MNQQKKKTKQLTNSRDSTLGFTVHFCLDNDTVKLMCFVTWQMGSFVPAESATLGVVDRLFARVGSSDNVSKHMSTFHLEMCETAHILNNATPTSLVILDEIGNEVGLHLLHYEHYQ